jgi:hypothetical protein
VERFRVASEKLEGDLSESRLEHDRMAASLTLAQLTATELEKVATEIDRRLVTCSNLLRSYFP